MTWTAKVLRVVASAAVAGALAGCSDSEATPEAPPTSSATSEPSPSVTTEPTEPVAEVPTVSAAAQQPGRGGAKAFARYYIDLLNYATVTGDTRGLREATTRCSGCDRYAELFERVYGQGGFIETDGWIPFSEVVVPQGPDFIVSIQVKSEPQRYRESSTSAVETAEREAYSLRFVLQRKDGGWTIADMQGREVAL